VIQAKLRLAMMGIIVTLVVVVGYLAWVNRGMLNVVAAQDGTIKSQAIALASHKIISQATSTGMMKHSETIRGLEMASGIMTKEYLNAINRSTNPCLDEPVVDRNIIGVFFIPDHGGNTGANVPASNVDE